MADWGFWEWVGYLPIAIAAVIIGAEGALGLAPRLQAFKPGFLRAHAWKFVPLSLILVSLCGFAVDYSLPKQDYINEPIAVFYGSAGPAGSQIFVERGRPETITGPINSKIVADGRLLRRLEDRKYRLVAICFHAPGSIDPLDVGNLSKSKPFDILPENIEMIIPWSPTYLQEFSNGLVETAYVLLALPPAMNETSFSTVREAQSLGAIILQKKGGPP